VSFRVADDMDSFWTKLDRGAWEPETLAALIALVRPGMLVLDVGAWIGPISLLCAALGARVVALEPDPRAFERLEANLAANPGLASRVEAMPVALSPEGGRLRLGSPRKQGDSMASLLLADRAPARWEAEAITASELSAHLGPAGPDIVKMDVEGAEYGLAPHLGVLLPASLTALILAVHPSLLAEAGHEAAAIDTMTRGLEAALAGFAARPLDGGDARGGGIAREHNTTMLFERAGDARRTA
jgi:FkbM family methyltransferase